QTVEHEDRGKDRRRSRKRRGRAARAEDGARGARAETGAGLRTLAALQHHEQQDAERRNDLNDYQSYVQHKSYRDPAAARIARNSSALSEAPPIRPPSTSGMAKSSAALLALTLPPYRIRVTAAIVASWAAMRARMK